MTGVAAPRAFTYATPAEVNLYSYFFWGFDGADQPAFDQALVNQLDKIVAEVMQSCGATDANVEGGIRLVNADEAFSKHLSSSKRLFDHKVRDYSRIVDYGSQ